MREQARDGAPSASRWVVLRPTPTTFSEVDLAGEDLIDFSFSGGNTSFRAIKVPVTTFDIGVLRAAVAAP
jgi:hypothetical protein